MYCIAALALGASGCGGGGGGGGPTPRMSSAPTGPTHPASNNDSATYAGTITTTFTRLKPAPVTVAPPTTTTQTVAIATKVSTGATFGATAGLTDFHSVETDTQTSPVVVTTTTLDAYQSLVPSGAQMQIVSPGYATSDSNGKVTTTVYGAGNGLLDVLPELAGATFSNNAALTYAETDADTTKALRTVNADGTYNESDTFPDQTHQTLAVLPDLSGLLKTVRGSIASITIGAPTGNPATIPFTLSFAGNAMPTVNLSVAKWYPTSTLASDTFAISTGAGIPAACNTPAAIGSSATAVVEHRQRLDPLLGTFDNQTTTQYFGPSYGLACVQFADQIDDYYEYSRQVSGIDNVVGISSTPYQTTTIAETIGLRTASIAGAPVVALGPTSYSFVVGRASFDRVIANEYARRRSDLHRALSHHPTLEGVIR